MNGNDTRTAFCLVFRKEINLDDCFGYCPKFVDMDSFDAAYFIAFTNEINLRPRKCLGWKSPYEVFFHASLHLT